MELYKITEAQAGFLKGKNYDKDMEFNPVQDVNNNWFLSIEEVEGNKNWRYKDMLSLLKLGEYVAPIIDII